jgi:GNAT superfamily N-acetyltransferase
MTATLEIRLVDPADYSQWRLLWDGYNEFYGRVGDTALPEAVTAGTWERFFNPLEPVFCLVALADARVVGIAHYLFHRSTTKLGPVCYLQDLFTEPQRRGAGVGRSLIEGVCAKAKAAGATRVYWHTQATNATGRALYDQVARQLGFIVYSRDPL